MPLTAVTPQALAPRDRATVAALAAALPARPIHHHVAKRLLDLTGATALLLLTLPVLLVAGLAIALDSRGPVVFTQERVGLHGRTFRLHKLRTMTHGNDEAQRVAFARLVVSGVAVPDCGLYKLARDSRITRSGRVLRRFSLDELPQLWNVLRGDMSLVGPRPAVAHEVALYDEHALRRLHVKPGLTGPWQVGGRAQLSFVEMIALDLDYGRQWSVGTDVRILLRTPWAALAGRGAA